MKTKKVKGWVPGYETEKETLSDTNGLLYTTKKACLDAEFDEDRHMGAKRCTITVTVEHEK